MPISKMTRELDQLAIDSDVIWDYAENRRTMPFPLANGQSFPKGILLLHSDSHRVWSFRDTETAIAFLRLWLNGIEAKTLPNLARSGDSCSNALCGLTSKGKRVTGCGVQGDTIGFHYQKRKRLSSVSFCPSCANLYEQFS